MSVRWRRHGAQPMMSENKATVTPEWHQPAIQAIEGVSGDTFAHRVLPTHVFTRSAACKLDAG
jgi:hypothetical protein